MRQRQDRSFRGVWLGLAVGSVGSLVLLLGILISEGQVTVSWIVSGVLSVVLVAIVVKALTLAVTAIHRRQT